MRTAPLFCVAIPLVAVTAPVITQTQSAPEKAVAAALVARDTAFVKQNATEAIALLAPDYTEEVGTELRTRDKVSKSLTGLFGDMKAIAATSRMREAVTREEGNLVEATVVQKLALTLKEPLPGMPSPLIQVFVKRETWRKNPEGWQIVSSQELPLVKELTAMAAEDQEIRRQIIAHRDDKALARKMDAVDKKNTTRLKEIVAANGWPGYSKLGSEGAHNMWLMVQHADHDVPFQEKCLPLLRQAVAQGEADATDMAYLTDRVRVNRKKPQVYGTQYKEGKGGKMVPQPIEDAANVERRRAAVGLMSMAEYEKLLAKMYKPGK